jgi:hypothetical protein
VRIENAKAEPDSTGVFVCMTRGCPNNDATKTFEFPHNADWPLAARQHKCRKCKKPLMLYKVKKVMSEEAKAKLKALGATRKRRRTEVEDE